MCCLSNLGCAHLPSISVHKIQCILRVPLPSCLPHACPHAVPNSVLFNVFRLMLLTDLFLMKISLPSVLDRLRPLPPFVPSTPSSGVIRTALHPRPSGLCPFISIPPSDLSFIYLSFPSKPYTIFSTIITHPTSPTSGAALSYKCRRASPAFLRSTSGPRLQCIVNGTDSTLATRFASRYNVAVCRLDQRSPDHPLSNPTYVFHPFPW